MTKTSFIARLAAFSAAAAVTFSVVAVIADYGLPAEGAQILVRTSATVAK